MGVLGDKGIKVELFLALLGDRLDVPHQIGNVLRWGRLGERGDGWWECHGTFSIEIHSSGGKTAFVMLSWTALRSRKVRSNISLSVSRFMAS